ncbi:MAG: winged helix-turn-helix domain-containing protein [Lysobacteraceae bacterium]
MTLADPTRLHELREHLKIGAFTVDFGALTVLGPDREVRLTPKAASVLVVLARRQGQTVARDELLDLVWRNSFTTPDVVGHAITALRRALGDNPESPSFIETIPRVGYRLIAPATFEAAESQAATPPETARRPMAAGSADAGSRAALGPSAIWGLALALVAATLFVLALLASPSREPAGGSVEAIGEPRLLTYFPGSERWPALSASGGRLVYAHSPESPWGRQLYIQSTAVLEPRRLTDDPDADHLQARWRNDDSELLYLRRGFDGGCELRILVVESGSQRTVTGCPAGSGIGFDWSPADPDLIALSYIARDGSGGSGIQLLRLNGDWQSALLDYPHDGATLDLEPRFSPDGSRVAFRRGPNPNSTLHVVAVAGGEPQRLGSLTGNIRGHDWTPDGQALVASVAVDGVQRLVLVDVASGAHRELPVANAAQPSLARHRDVVVYEAERQRIALSLVDAPGVTDGQWPEPSPWNDSTGNDLGLALSPDGTEAVIVSDRTGGFELWHRAVDSERTLRLTDHGFQLLEKPVWSPAGDRIAYIARQDGRFEVWEHNRSTGGSTLLLSEREVVREVLYHANGRDLWLVAGSADSWRLLLCRRHEGNGCSSEDTGVPAIRIERDDDGRLWTTRPDAILEARILDEATLEQVDTVALPENEGWSLQGDQVFYLRVLAEDRMGLGAFDWREGGLQPLRTLGSIRPPPYSRPQRTSGGDGLILPMLVEDNTDIGLVELSVPEPSR